MIQELKIREADHSDFDTIYHFVNELEETVFDIEPMKKAFEHNISNPDAIYLIAEIHNKPVGYLSCHTQLLLHHGGQKIAEIQEMYVSPDTRKIGVGKQLINELKKMARNKGIVQIEVTSNNIRTDTHRFYMREKFIQSHQKFTFMLEE